MRLVVRGLITVLIVTLLGIIPAVAQDAAPRTTPCFECQSLADRYNAAATAASAAKAEWDRLDAEKSAVQAQIGPVVREMDRATGRIAREESYLANNPGLLPADVRRHQNTIADEQRRLQAAQADGAKLDKEMERLEPAVWAAEAAFDAANAAKDKAAAELDECEERCEARGGPSLAPDGVTVITPCPACQDLAKALNDTLSERRGIGGKIVLAQTKLDTAKGRLGVLQNEQRAALNEAEAATLQAGRLRAERPQNIERIRNADQRASAASARALDMDAGLSDLADEVAEAQAEVDRLVDRRDRVLPQQEATQRAELEACEKRMCGPPASDPAGQVGAPVLPAITSACPACQELASELQETLEAISAKGSDVDAFNRDLERERSALAAATAAEKAVHEDAIADLVIARDAVLADYNALVRLAREQLKSLEECERNCEKTPPERPLPDLRTSLLQQDDECRRNQECALLATLTNEGEDDAGPLFISFDARLLLPEDGQLGGLTCLAAARGKTLCYGANVAIEGGASLSLVVPAVAEPEICFAREMPHADDHSTIGAWVQFGLTDRGFPLGAIDGQIGPKTYAAIAAMIESDDAPAPVGMTDDELLALLDQRTAINRDLIESEVFERLFGEQPSSAEDREEMLDCIRLRLVREAQVPKPKAVVPVEEEEDDTIRLDTRPRIVLDLGGGGGGEEEPVQEESESFPVEDPGFGELPGLGEFGF